MGYDNMAAPKTPKTPKTPKKSLAPAEPSRSASPYDNIKTSKSPKIVIATPPGSPRRNQMAQSTDSLNTFADVEDNALSRTQSMMSLNSSNGGSFPRKCKQ